MLDQWSRDYKLYHGYIDMTSRDPDMPNTFIPKIRNIVETKVPRYIRAAHSVRPYIPFDAIRSEYKSLAKDQEQMLDFLLDRAGFIHKRILGKKVSCLYGTAFMEGIPYFENVLQKQTQMDQFGIPRTVQSVLPRLRLKLRVFAPWEILPDPYATGLETPEQCRYLIKIDVVSRRQILELAAKGAYPGLMGPTSDIKTIEDFDEFMRSNDDSVERGKPWGFHLGDIRAPVHLWHGTADTMVPVAMGEFLAVHLKD